MKRNIKNSAENINDNKDIDDSVTESHPELNKIDENIENSVIDSSKEIKSDTETCEARRSNRSNRSNRELEK